MGRKLPSPSLPTPPIYQMRIFAPDKVVAMSRFWYFVKLLKKIKKTNSEILECSQVSQSIHVLHVNKICKRIFAACGIGVCITYLLTASARSHTCCLFVRLLLSDQ